MRHNYDKVIIRDVWDKDIFHLGYRWLITNQERAKYSQRTSMTIHIDDIDGMFGEQLSEAVKEMKPGSWEFIRFVDDGCVVIDDD